MNKPTSPEKTVPRQDETPAGQRVSVLFPLPLPKPYDYLCDAPPPPVGGFVVAPFGPREVVGVVWPSLGEAPPRDKLKSVIDVLDAPPLARDLVDFVDWAADYTMFPKGAVLRMTMRVSDALAGPRMQTAYVKTGAAPSRLTPQREKVLAAAGPTPMAAAALASAAGVSEAVVRGLAEAGALARVDVDPDPPFDPPDLTRSGRDLSADQQYAARLIGDIVAAGGHKAALIDGVTGSGKTEVYFEAVAAALGKDPEAQALILLPEIALTLPFLARVEERFGAAPAPWHSDLTGAQRRRSWRRVAEGQARLVVGARSALFLPFKKLRLIVVDAAMPHIHLIDMREHAPEAGRWLSPPLVDAVNANLAAGEQSLLFLNRRGYAPLTLCRRCGHKMTAPGSDTMLVEHRFENRLVCHHTGFSMPKPSACPVCNAVDSLTACGPGVERVAEEAKARWPAARIAVLSSDTAVGPRAVREVLDAMHGGEIDILIATQVAAKGHHFPNLTLVGVVDADLGLAGGDLRAAERTYQLLSQVTGRAGRAEKPGRALLQTYQPEAAVLRALASGDRDAFLAAEAAGRSALGYPPYGRLAAITLRSQDETLLDRTANALRAAAPAAEGVDILGPARAPIYRLRGVARMRLLVKTRRNVHVQAFLADWLTRVKIPGAVRISVDINPYSFL